MRNQYNKANIATFGELRSLMHQPFVDPDYLFYFLKSGQKNYPIDYETYWIPYMMEFPHHFVGSIARVGTMTALKQRLKLLPFGFFHAYFRRANSFTVAPETNSIQSMHLQVRLTKPAHFPMFESFISQPFESLTSLCVRKHSTGSDLIHFLNKIADKAPLELLQIGVNYGRRRPFPVTAIDSRIGDEGLRKLSESKVLKNIYALSLQSCGITHTGLESLLQSPFIKNLKILDLSGNRIGDEGAEMLSTSENLRNLCTLCLRSIDYRECADHHQISEHGWNMIQQSDVLSNTVKEHIRRYAPFQHVRIVGEWWHHPPSG